MDEEKCNRCGQIGQDRRTLWMACLYEMSELGLPFTELAVRGSCRDVTEGRRPFPEGNSLVTAFLKEELEMLNGEKAQILNRFYTLRVCKDCRGDWLSAIKAWFNTIPRESPGTGIFVRENGTSRELTEEEVRERFPEWKPE